MKRDLKADLELCSEVLALGGGQPLVGAQYTKSKYGLGFPGGPALFFYMSRDGHLDDDDFRRIRFIRFASEGWPHAIERALKAEALVRELVDALRGISEILDNATCRCRCGFCEYFKAQKIAEKSLAKAKEVLGDE